MTQRTKTEPGEVTSGSLQEFAKVAEAISATTKKLEKAALLGDYLRGLNDVDLARAARYLAGHQFALSDSRTTNVGGRIIGEALSTATGLSLENLSPRYVRLGDAGEVAFEVVEETHGELEPKITLAETESIITRLSETRGTKNKTALLSALLHQASPLEAKYLVKLLVGDLRIGLKEGLVEDATARAFGQPLVEAGERIFGSGERAGELGPGQRIGDGVAVLQGLDNLNRNQSNGG